ncbi:MAG: primosomal protein N', partial [bacterium]
MKSSEPRKEPMWRWSEKISYEQALQILPPQAHRLRQAVILLKSYNGKALQSILENEVKGIGSSLKNLLNKGWIEYEMVFKSKPIPFGEGLPETRLKEDVELTPEQSTILDQIKPYIHQRQFHIFLIHGVTGSGKTVVYRELVGGALNTGRKALVLVPEIGLTPQLAGRFRVKFGDKVAITHSGLTPTQRREVWQRVRRGDQSVVVGARSAIFTPFDDLGIIVVDEEQDESYKQDDNNPRYNARDCAIKLGQIARCPVVLGSATPDIVSFYNTQKGRYTLLELKTRYQGVVPPQVWVVKWWGVKEGSLFSPQLKVKLQACWENGQQAVILVNRRGFSTYVQCPSCGSVARCPNCDITLRYHRGDFTDMAHYQTLSERAGDMHSDYGVSKERMECHYCGYVQPVIDRCPHCGADRMLFKGTGTQRVVREIQLLIPEARIARMDRDSVRNPGELHHLLLKLARHEIDILIGTQMVAKGHDFPRIALVGVLMADLEWLHPDFRSLERAFRILVQASGR